MPSPSPHNPPPPRAPPLPATATATTMAPRSHHSKSASTPVSPATASSGGNATRPTLMKRQSSQGSHTSSTRPGLASPAASDQHLQHHAARVKPRHKVVLPRNHSSARNLAKMSKQAQGGGGGGQHVAFDDGRRHARQRSHEGDTAIRLPGSLDESVQSRPAIRRNLTAHQLPRTQSQSQVKLKKNLSHGQLSRLGGGHGGSSRNLAGLGGHGTRAPASPGLKGRSKRPKSAEITPAEYRALQERKGSGQERKGSGQKGYAPKKVGFAVGSDEEDSGDYEDDDDETGVRQLDMEGSGLQEDEWTEESASASPYSTRQNTANNSRRTSLNLGAKERIAAAVTPSDLLAAKVSEGVQRKKVEMESAAKLQVSDSDESSDEEDDPPSPRTMARTRHDLARKEAKAQAQQQPPLPPPVAQQQRGALQQQQATEHVPQQHQQQQHQQQQHQQQQASMISVHDYAHHEEDVSSRAAEQQLPRDTRQHQRPPQPQQPEQESTTKPRQLSFAPPIYKQETAQGHAQLETHATAPPNAQPQQAKERAQASKKAYANPAAKRVTSQQHLPSPAAVTNVSALDSHHSTTSSPAPSVHSSTSNLAGGSKASTEHEDDELVSNFVPSASHPSVGSGLNTALNTPKQGSGFHTPEEHHGMSRADRSGFQIAPTSPGSTISGSSGHNTPAHGMGRSRTELRLLQEKALADLETRAEIVGASKPVLPGHVYDRRNESLKSFMTSAEQHNGLGLSMGPQIFQGRFRAVNTELRVVQKFRDPVGEAIARLRGCKGSKLNRPTSSASVSRSTGGGGGLAMSKSAVSLPSAQRGGTFSKSASPPKSDMARQRTAGGQSPQVNFGGHTGGGSERVQSRRGVSFAGGPPPKSRETQTPISSRDGTEMTSADVARVAQELWNDL